MQMTMMEGVRELQAVENSSILEISRILSKALLIGSKGNSGVILSQFLMVFMNLSIVYKRQLSILKNLLKL